MEKDRCEECAPLQTDFRVNERQGKRKVAVVGASELAQMGVCERLMVFEHRYGKRRTPRQRGAIIRGQAAHDQFFREGKVISDDAVVSTKRGRCYIATLIFGTGPATAVLRAFRERVLRPSSNGRWLIAMYYRTAPAICAMLDRHPWLLPIVPQVLRGNVRALNKSASGEGDDHGK